MKFVKAETQTVKENLTSYLVLELLGSPSGSKLDNSMKN